MNWNDKTIFIGDNLHVMRGMNSDSVDLIYLDPPFNSNRNYAAPIGSQACSHRQPSRRCRLQRYVDT
jgi:DNA modification methylase